MDKKTGAERTYTLNKTIRAPIQFVFDWCTDFRVDDYKLTDSTFRRKMVSRSSDQIVYVDEEKVNGQTRRTRSVVTLSSPNRWMLHAEGDAEDEEGEYQLVSKTKNSTVLNMTFRVKHKLEPVPTRARWERDGHEFWDKLIIALEKEYRARGRSQK